MGVGSNTGRFTFVNISKGRIVIKKDNVIQYHGYVEGYLKDIEIRDEEFQGRKYKKLSLRLNDGSEDYLLQMDLGSGYGVAFCKMIKNVDFNFMLKITPTYSEDGVKKQSGMFINQDGLAVKWFYKKDSPGDLPPLEKVVFKGEEHWDNSKQQAFFIDMLMNVIRPKLKKETEHEIINGPVHQFDDIPNANQVTQPIDDLPF